MGSEAAVLWKVYHRFRDGLLHASIINPVREHNREISIHRCLENGLHHGFQIHVLTQNFKYGSLTSMDKEDFVQI